MPSIDGFEADLEAFAKQIDADLSKVVRRITVQLFTKIVQRTPVDTGRARASWIVTLDQPNLLQTAPEGSAEPQTKSIPSGGAFSVYWITNNLPYIQKLEFGGYGEGPKTSGGFSKQAPHGMVRVSLAEVEAELETSRGL